MASTHKASGRPTIWDRRLDMLAAELVEARLEARRAHLLHTVVGWPASALSALVSTTIFASDNLRELAGCAAALVAVLTATNAFFNPQRQMSRAEQRVRGLKALLLDVERTMGSHNESVEWWTLQLRRVDRRYEQITGDQHDAF
jgi:hypothetical protein